MGLKCQVGSGQRNDLNIVPNWLKLPPHRYVPLTADGRMFHVKHYADRPLKKFVPTRLSAELACSRDSELASRATLSVRQSALVRTVLSEPRIFDFTESPKWAYDNGVRLVLFYICDAW